MGSYIEVNEPDFDDKVLDSSTPVLVDFWAPWCGPCRSLAPHVEAIGEEYAGRVTVAKVNVDNNQNIALKYGIRGLPTLVVFNQGEEKQRVTGMPGNTRASLRKMVEDCL